VKNNIQYREGNAIKYIVRHASKNGAEDIKKAIHYLEMILEDYEREAKDSCFFPNQSINLLLDPFPGYTGSPELGDRGHIPRNSIPVRCSPRLGADERDSSQLPEVPRDEPDPRQLSFDWKS